MRVANGIVSAVIVCLFVAHGLLAAFSAHITVPNVFEWLIWLGVALVAVHVAFSIVTSYQQLNDKEHPPSARKKHHLVLKWVTGGLLLAMAVAHYVFLQVYGARALQTGITGIVILVVLTVALAVHICIGAKSLLSDLSIKRNYMTAFRVVVIVLAVIIGVAVVAVALR